MTRVLVLTTCIVVLSLFLQLAKTELQVELVQVLFRHGERTPRDKEMYPNDPHDISTYEPWGLGQLTNQGKMREYRIGLMLRQRYNKFLSDIYRPTDVYAISTDVDRTKMSLQLVLSGLYNPSKTQMWNENLHWIPVPTHYLPKKVDSIMKPDVCPIYEEALEKVRNSDVILQKNSEYKNLYKFLTVKTGLNITHNESTQVYEVYNLLASQKAMNLTLPKWCTDEVFKKMQEVVLLEYETRSYTTKLKRLNGGMLIKRFIKNMDINSEYNNPRKIYLYSGHEVNVAAFARAHSFSEPKLPAYGSAILVEKLRDKNGKLYIQLLLWTGVTELLHPLKLTECDVICPIDKYLKLLHDIIPSDEESNCLWNYITKEELQDLYKDKVFLD